jgi:protein-S-isoprenylcysteine O-methyltransferase Ste14
MAGTGPSATGSDTPEAQRQKPAGAWAGYVIYGLFLLFLIFFDARFAYNRRWADVAGVTVFTLIFMLVPTGGVKLLRRWLRGDRRPSRP